MVGRIVVIAALAVYVIIVGCAAIPSDGPPTHTKTPAESILDEGAPTTRPKLTGLPYRGIAMQIQKVDAIPAYLKSLDEIAAIGADTVSFVVDCRQENGSSGRIFMDMRMTPTPEQLAVLIKHAKDLNLRVVLMPIVLLDNPRGNEWRGTIKPDLWDEWFDSYRLMMRHYSMVAEMNHVDVLVIGSELVSSESKLEEWTKTVRTVRKVYKGQITYSSNWDHYRSIPFWDQLDLIGMNSYWNLGIVGGTRIDRKDLTVEKIEARWAEIQQDLLAFQKQEGKPLLLLEAGWCSLQNAAHEPWDYTKTNLRIDLDLQRRLYEAFFRSWYGKPGFGGFMMWEWTLDNGGLEDRGYTPEGKPAAKVLKDWLAKPAWQVSGN